LEASKAAVQAGGITDGSLRFDNSLKTDLDIFRPGAIIPFLQFTPKLDAWKTVLYDSKLPNCLLALGSERLRLAGLTQSIGVKELPDRGEVCPP
jgi:hypothetical protein